MAHKTLTHPVLGDRLTVLTTAEESGGELFRFEYAARAVTPPPPDHMHAEQEERIEVLAGRLHCRINGEERVLRTGERIVFPAGVYHTVWNADVEGSRSMGEYRPALDTEAMFDALFVA